MQITKGLLTPELKDLIYEELARLAGTMAGTNGLKDKPVAFEIRDGQTLIGCVVVQIFWGQLHIKYLLVGEMHRGCGIGKLLMKHALEYGKQQNCNFAFVETMSFQAIDFYKKLGFKVELKRDGYNHGTSFYYLRKDLL